VTQPDTTPDPDGIAEAARVEADAATATARDETDAAAIDARTATTAAADAARRAISHVTAPDFLAAADPDLGGYLAVARQHIAAAAKDKTFKQATALVGSLPDGRTRRMVERLVIRGYAQGSSTTRRFLADLCALTRNTEPAELEAQVEVALRVHAAECDAEVRDLWDVHAAATPGPGRELATVKLDRVPLADAGRRVSGLGGAQ